MNLVFFISFIITDILLIYILNDFKKEKASKCKFNCSECKVKSCIGHYCEKMRNNILKDD